MNQHIDEKLFGRKSDRLPIDEACRQMLVFAYTALRQFPKSEKHGLAAEIRDSMWLIQRLVVSAIRKHHKKTAVTDLDIELALLKRRVRLAMELKYLSPRAYEMWARHLTQLGAQVGGWLKALYPERHQPTQAKEQYKQASAL